MALTPFSFPRVWKDWAFSWPSVLVWLNGWMECLFHILFCVDLLVDIAKGEIKDFRKASLKTIWLAWLPSPCRLRIVLRCAIAHSPFLMSYDLQNFLWGEYTVLPYWYGASTWWTLIKGTWMDICDIGHIWTEALRVSVAFYQPSYSIPSAPRVAAWVTGWEDTLNSSKLTLPSSQI